jgi:hypothetical protein
MIIVIVVVIIKKGTPICTVLYLHTFRAVYDYEQFLSL